jgi:hypothetical protein
VLDGTNINKWNAGANNMTVTHKSKVFLMPKPVNMCIAKVIADAYPCTFKLYADDRAAWTKTVTSEDEFWLPDGYLARDYQIEASTALDITGIVIADNLPDLMG